MDEGQLLTTQAERDRLVALKKAKKKLITQKQAAEEISVTEGPDNSCANYEGRGTGRLFMNYVIDHRTGRWRWRRSSARWWFLPIRCWGFGPTLGLRT